MSIDSILEKRATIEFMRSREGYHTSSRLLAFIIGMRISLDKDYTALLNGNIDNAIIATMAHDNAEMMKIEQVKYAALLNQLPPDAPLI